MILTVRNAVHAAKSLKDTHQDLDSFRESVDDRLNAWLSQFRCAARELFELLDRMHDVEQASRRFEILIELKSRNETLHAKMHADIYDEVALRHRTEVQISTLLNVNRELYLSNQSLLASLADVLLDTEAAADYDSIPMST